MDPTKFLWILSLNVVFLIGSVTATDGSVAASSVTGVVADLDAVNTTALYLIWDSPTKNPNITIERYVIKVDNVTHPEITSDNETSSYNYTITGLEPGVNYSVTLIVVYTQEIDATTVVQETTQEIETTTVAQVTTTVTVLETSTTSALTTQSTVLSTSSVAPVLRESITLEDSIYLFNNTYPETPTGIIRTGRDAHSLTFTWNQEGKADGCHMWTDDAATTGTYCYFHSNGSATGTISNLPVAGIEYTVLIISVSGGLNSSEVSTMPERTLPPNPSAPQCISQTNTSFTFMIPPPFDYLLDSFELDEYVITVLSLINLFQYNTTTIVNVANRSSENIQMTINDVGIAAGVTYGITLTSRVAGVSSAGSNSSNCVTEPNVPIINGIVETTEVMVNATWQAPSGYFNGFNVSCFGQNSAKNDSAIKYQNQTSSGTPQTLSAECNDVTAGALYEVNIVSILLNQSVTSKASDSVFNVTVPYAPTKVEPTNATTTTLIQLAVAYEYDESDSQCTHFEVSILTEAGTVEKTETILVSNPTVEFVDLTADRRYNFSTYAVSNYTHSNSNFSRRSTKSTPTSAWTLSPSVSNITELEREPWSLLVQFDQRDPHEHVWKYTIHVDAESGRIKTIDLTCTDVSMEESTKLNCDPTNPDVQTIPIDCGTRSSCDATTALPESTQGVAEATTVTDLKTTTTTVVPEDVTTSTNVARLLEDSTAQSICFNISDLQPYINYSISVQAVNPGGCSVKESVALFTAESIPGCVDITYFNSSYNSIEVYWNPPDKPNGIITQYVISYTRQDGKPTLGTNPIYTTDAFCIISPLEPYVAYNITVAAETSVGVGASSGCPLSNTLVSTSITKPYKPSLELYAIDSTSINISWTLERDVMTGPKTYYNLTITDTVDVALIVKQHVEGFYNRSIVVDGLDEYWRYSVAIVAYTVNELGLELSTKGTTDYITTLESIPGPVQLLTVTSLSSDHKCYLARVVWEPPTDREKNGIITGYTVTWNETEDTFAADTRSAEVEVEPNDKSYSFTIVATTVIGAGTNVSEVLGSTGICRPAPLNVETVFAEHLNRTQTSFTVIYDPLFFTGNANGPVIANAILVAEDSINLTDIEVYGGQELFNGALKWKAAIDVNPIPEYRPTPDGWLNDSSGSLSRRQRRELSATYIVGKDGSCSDEDVYCNGPLQPGRNYRVRGVICTQQDMCYKTGYLSHIFETGTVETPPESMAWIAGVVFGILALIALIIVLLYFLYFKKKRRSPYESRDDNGRELKDVKFPVSPQELAKPVRVIDFSAHVVEMHRNSDLEFNDEYQSIQNLSARRPWTAAEKPKNRVKNRFVNILPFDHSRVTLRGTDNDPDDSESDYINANYIPTIRGIREFIACQGPLESTKDDFWQMVWEHDCRVIVMLTNLKERGREKCAQYWPERQNEPSRFRNDIYVDLITESFTDHHAIRKFRVWAGTQTRDIFQFHFLSWPDFGVPDDPEMVLSFIRMVRKYAGNNVDPPMVVHCSAGVGRTGTFIVLDRLLRELPRAETIDIFSMVLQLRQNRCLMVQTEAQYVFIHDCMKLEIERTLGYENHNYDDFDESSFTEESVYQNASELANNLQTLAHD